MNQIALEPNKTYREKEIANMIQSANPFVSEARVKWVLFDMQKKNQITRVGCRAYVSGGGKPYDHDYKSKVARNIAKALSQAFPLLKIVVWESVQLNEWTNLLLSKNMVFVEVESGFESIVFDGLMRVFGDKHTLLLRPNEEMIARYMRDDLIIIRTLFSRAPIHKKKRDIMLEKLAVDVIADKYLSGLLGTSGAYRVIRGIKSSYTINESRMFTYAARRGKEKELRDIWEDES